MKIRSDFVTNSSSSSYVSIHFRCKKLREILDEYQEYLDAIQYGLSDAVSDDSFDFEDEWDDVNVPKTKNDIINSLLDFIESGYLETDEEQEKFEELSEELHRNSEEIIATINHVKWNGSNNTNEDDVGGDRDLNEEYTLENGKETYHRKELIDGEIIDDSSSVREYSQNDPEE